MQGVITGGWEYVWAAYLVTWIGLVVYGVILIARRARAVGPTSKDERSHDA